MASLGPGAALLVSGELTVGTPSTVTGKNHIDLALVQGQSVQQRSKVD